MPEQGRLGDISRVPSDSHGCLSCAHACEGPATQGSPDVYVNGRPALRVDDPGVHSGCCGPNTWKAAKGAPCVYFNGKKAHRKGDAVQHCGGMGALQEGSGDVYVGDCCEGNDEPLIEFDGRFKLFDEVTGVLLTDMPYRIHRSNGRVVSGRTDENGMTEPIETYQVEDLELEIVDPARECDH